MRCNSRDDHSESIVAARCQPYADIGKLHHRAGISASGVETLAAADAFRSPQLIIPHASLEHAMADPDTISADYSLHPSELASTPIACPIPFAQYPDTRLRIDDGAESPAV